MILDKMTDKEFESVYNTFRTHFKTTEEYLDWAECFKQYSCLMDHAVEHFVKLKTKLNKVQLLEKISDYVIDVYSNTKARACLDKVMSVGIISPMYNDLVYQVYKD